MGYRIYEYGPRYIEIKVPVKKSKYILYRAYDDRPVNGIPRDAFDLTSGLTANVSIHDYFDYDEYRETVVEYFEKFSKNNMKKSWLQRIRKVLTFPSK